jgi:hypothetical protein
LVGRITGPCQGRIDLREIRGIPALALSAFHHVFGNIRGNRMNIGHFYDLAYFNCFYCFKPFRSKFGLRQTPKTPSQAVDVFLHR